MKAYSGRRGIAQVILHLGTSVRLMVGFMPWLLHPLENRDPPTKYSLNRSLDGPHNQYRCYGEQNFLAAAGNRTRIIEPIMWSLYQTSHHSNFIPQLNATTEDSCLGMRYCVMGDSHFKYFGLLDPWKMEASQACKMQGTTYQTTEYHISKDSKLQQCCSENLSVINLYSDAINTSDYCM